MITTLGTLAIMGIITVFAVFAGYVIFTGDREESKRMKAK